MSFSQHFNKLINIDWPHIREECGADLLKFPALALEISDTTTNHSSLRSQAKHLNDKLQIILSFQVVHKT